MSIDDELCEPQTVTEGDRALLLFTDRYELTRLFAEYLNEEPPRKTILFFHGDGGNGKSLLLKFLRQRCCKRFLPETWQQLQAIPKDEVAKVAAYIEKAKPENYIAVPAVLLDFSQNLIGDRLKSPFDGLLMLRRNLAEAFAGLPYRLRFPLYDFACVWYFYKTGNLEQAKELLPSDEMDLITGIVDAVSDTSYASIAKAVLGVFGKHLGEKFKLYLQKRGLKEEDVKAIQGMEPHRELIDELPRLFAKDLNAAMAQQEELKRIVLFFDAHEAFWGDQRDLSEEVFFQRDEWLRCLLRALDLDAGIVTVVAGREKPRWAEATRSAIPQHYLDTRLVGHFSATDARDYLQKADIKDAALQQSLIDYASVAADEVHPLYLGLCADIVLAARAQGKFLTPDDFPTAPETSHKSRVLINRLLRYVDKGVEVAVHALSACRAFDFELYLKLGQALHFHATRAAFFDILTRFSFVWQAQRRGENWYRIHDLLRRLDDESGNEINRRAHEVLEQHYQEQGEVAEAIYHANRLDWERGVGAWIGLFDAFVQFSRYDECRTLLEVRSELWIQNTFYLGCISRLEGDYFAQFARYAEAEQKYLEAVAAYDQALKLTPNNAVTLYNKAIALVQLGELQTQHTQALQFYRKAIATCNSALTLSADDINALNNKGNALSKLGERQTQLDHQHSEALQSYKDAIDVYNRILTFDPNYVKGFTNKGIALQNLGDLQTRRDEHSEALQSYKDAIDAHNSALTLDPNCVSAFNNKGIALSKLGELQTRLDHQHSEALQSYKDAIGAYNCALSLTTDNHIQLLNNKGTALQYLGNLQTRLAQHSEAFASYTNAIATYGRALSLAPDNKEVLKNKGIALKSLGDLQEKLPQQHDALKSWQEAVATFTRYLEIVPSDEDIRIRVVLLQLVLNSWSEDTPSD